MGLDLFTVTPWIKSPGLCAGPIHFSMRKMSFVKLTKNQLICECKGTNSGALQCVSSATTAISIMID